MAGDETKNNDVYSANDPLDINELAALNDEISAEFIEQLQNQVSQDASKFTGRPIIDNNDADLFEEPNTVGDNINKPLSLDSSIDDNFIKKYKAKLNKQQMANEEAKQVLEKPQEPVVQKPEEVVKPKETKKIETPVKKEEVKEEPKESLNEIEQLTSGNIIEKPASQEQIDYNNSLDFVDDNIKYSKYVIYIDPENKDFIESLTVKERKNLINKILREQDDITVTRRRLNLIQAIIKHSIIAIITVAIAVPVIYTTINASLEASIDNYRRSGKMFEVLYREKGKIKTNRNR